MDKHMMDAAVLEKVQKIHVEKRQIPIPKVDEALVKVYCIGICGSDVHYYEHGEIGRYKVEAPLILGHEVAGKVVAIGSEVQNVLIGDRVAIEPGVSCGKCSYCKSGRYNLCPDVSFMATPPVDGAWADYVTIQSDFLFHLPDSMTFEEGALLEPLAVGFHALERGNVNASDRLFISGLGPIGLLAAQAAKLNGINEIYASDVVPFRRELALKMGVTAVIDPLQENVTDRLHELTNNRGIDVHLETSGNDQAISESGKYVKRGGKIILIGLPTVDNIPFNFNHFIDSEIDMYGVFRYANVYQKAIDTIANSTIKLEQVITHKFPLQEIDQAIDMAISQKDRSIKIMIYPN